MQSHDFASTYVGTPFYMSPEICAAERYTLKSDIWSLGCIIYELCSREPPFNAKSHFELVQKIKIGKVAPLPAVYSPELNGVIRDCLKVNPDRRPDTATLLNLPVVKLMRKEKEVVELGRLLKTKEDGVMQKLREAEDKIRRVESEKAQMRQEIEASLRREWEVKAQLEINRLVQIEIERLQKKFDHEVKEKVEFELQRRSTSSTTSSKDSSRLTGNNPLSSSIGESDSSTSTELTDLSTHSPEPTSKPMKKSTRTPFGRAQTMFAGQAQGTPMDVEMAEPSPISIASLSLSPRRNEGAKVPNTGRNIFAAAASAEARWQPTLMDSDNSDDDDLPALPSPTRSAKPSKNPFKSNGSRPPLISQKTAPMARHVQTTSQQQNLFGQPKSNTAPMIPTLTSVPDLRAQTSNSALKERSPSPNRRLSKIPSSSNLHENMSLSPSRKPSLKGRAVHSTDDLNKAVAQKLLSKATSAVNLAPKGRTLVELAQARAGGRSVEDGTRSPEPKGRAFAQRMADKNQNRSTDEPPVWDPERDEMPSPFLVRNRPMRRL